MAVARNLSRVVVLAGALACGACGVRESTKQAEALADRYFETAAAEDYDGILSLYGADLFSETPRDKVRAFLVGVHDRCGVPKTHDLKGWSVNTDFIRGSTRVDLRYEARYTQCTVSESISVVTPRDGTPRILGHHVNMTNAPPIEARVQTKI